MELRTQTPKQSLNKAFLKQPVKRDEIELFKVDLQTLLSKINEKKPKNIIKALKCLKNRFE